MTTTRGTALPALYGDALFRSVTLALPIEQVRRLLPPGVQLGSQSVTPAGTHPVIVSFNVLSRVRTAIPTLLPTLDYNEYTLGVPHSYSTPGLASAQSPGPFYYMPLLLLDSFLAVLGGLMWWGYRKQSANFTMTDEYCAIASTDDEPVTSLRWTGDGPYMSVDECQNFTPIRAMLDQPLLSQLPVGLGPFPMMARFEKQWSVARIRPIETSLVVNLELAHGLPVGKHPETARSPGIDSSVLGSYEYQSPFMLGVPYPVGAAR